MLTASELKQRRESLGLTQKELAVLCGFKSELSISFMERGERPISNRMFSQLLTFEKLNENDPVALNKLYEANLNANTSKR